MANATKHNGGRSQIGVSIMTYSGDYPFINLMKTAGMWAYNNGVQPYIDLSTCDSDGYPTVFALGGHYTQVYIPSQANRPGDYVLTWSGTGTVLVPGVKTGGSEVSTGTGSLTFTPSGQILNVGVSAMSASPNHIRNMKLVHSADVGSSETFSAIFKQRLLTEGNFGVIRFMDWQSNNTAQTTTWALRRPVTYYTYGTTSFIPAIYCSGVTNSGNAYSVTGNGLGVPATGAPADKQTITLQFSADATQSGTCTLNLNGTGAVNILNPFCNPLSVAGNSYPLKFQPGSTTPNCATMVYDATLNAWIKQGGDLALPNHGLNDGVPPELMLQLAAELGAHPHFTTPCMAIDPATDYMSSLAACCIANGPSWMVPRYEGPNEVFNSGNAGFMNTTYANAKSTAYNALDSAHWSTSDYVNWYGKVMSVLGQQIAAAYGVAQGNIATTSLYKVLCGVWTAQAGTSVENPRLNSTSYVNQTMAAQSGYVKSAAKNWVNGVCCAQYVGPSADGTNSPTALGLALAAAYAAGDQSAPGAYVDTMLGASSGYNLAFIAGCYSGIKTWAQGMGINYLTGYEGGYSPDYDGSWGTSDQLRYAGKNVYNLSGYTIANYTNFVSLTDATFTAEFPSCYKLSGNPIIAGHSGDVWSVLEDIYQTPDPPQWVAIKNWNSAKRAINLRMRIHG